MNESTFFALRHVATGHFMPETQHGRGYSNWTPTPTNPKGGLDVAMDGPRIFSTEKAADNARVSWAQGVHEHRYTSDGPDGPGDYAGTKPRDVGRKKDDIEIVPMIVAPASRAVVHIKLSVDEQAKVMREAFERTLAEYKEQLLDADAFGKIEALCRAFPKAGVRIWVDSNSEWAVNYGPFQTSGVTLNDAVDSAHDDLVSNPRIRETA